MTESSKTTHPLRIFAGSANGPLADQVARRLGVELGKCTTTFLPDSETHVIVDDAVRGDDIFLIQPCGPPVNDRLMELLLYVDAFRRASANTITAEQFRDEHFRDGVIVAPDEGRVKMAARYAETLNLPLAFMHKRRTGFAASKTMTLVGDLKGKIPIITNTLPLPPDTQHPKLRVISIAPLLATIIRRVHDGLSISGMLRLT